MTQLLPLTSGWQQLRKKNNTLMKEGPPCGAVTGQAARASARGAKNKHHKGSHTQPQLGACNVTPHKRQGMCDEKDKQTYEFIFEFKLPAPPSGLTREVGVSPGGLSIPASGPGGCASCNETTEEEKHCRIHIRIRPCRTAVRRVTSFRGSP